MFRFLDLPAEIRDQIYHDVLSTDTARRPPVDDDEPASYKFNLAILQANKQIHHEAKKAFQDNVFIKITTPWPESIDHISSEGRVPIITTGSRAEHFQAFHLWIWIDTPGFPLSGPAYSMLICLEDLPAFTRMWNFSNLVRQLFLLLSSYAYCMSSYETFQNSLRKMHGKGTDPPESVEPSESQHISSSQTYATRPTRPGPEDPQGPPEQPSSAFWSCEESA